MAAAVLRQQFLLALNEDRATPPPGDTQAAPPDLVDALLMQLKGDKDNIAAAAAARLEKLVVCDSQATERLLEMGGIAALVAVVNADPQNSSHSQAICIGQMAAAVALQHILMRLPTLSESMVKGGILAGLILMIDEGHPPMQRAAIGLLSTLANSELACKAICEAEGGMVLSMMLKTSKSALARRAAAQCLLKLVHHLTPTERQVVKSTYPLPHDIARPKAVKRRLIDF